MSIVTAFIRVAHALSYIHYSSVSASTAALTPSQQRLVAGCVSTAVGRARGSVMQDTAPPTGRAHGRDDSARRLPGPDQKVLAHLVCHLVAS